MKTVVIVIDAFRSDYINENDTPFLYALSKTSLYAEKIVPSPGFCERTEILTGLAPSESKLFTAFEFDPSDSPFKSYSFIFKFLGHISPYLSIFFTRVIRKILSKIAKLLHNGFAIYNFPFEVIPMFRLSEDKYPIDDDPRYRNSLVSYFGGARRNFFESFTSLRDIKSSSDNERVSKLLRNVGSDHSAYYLYLGDVDYYGHKYKRTSSQLIEAINQMDSKIRYVVENFKDVEPNTTFNIIGDHGMTPVVRHVNVRRELQMFLSEFKCSHGKDYIIFLDSTYCRIWLLTNKAMKLKKKLLSWNGLSSAGYMTDDFDAINIPNSNRQNGDLIWVAELGVLIWPDYFHYESSTPPVGMHGYLSNDNSLKGFYIKSGPAVSKSRIREIEINKIYDFIRSKV